MQRLEAEFQKKLKNFKLDMQFSIEGGTLGILGASGCGKSMTLKAVAGIVTPDSGLIRTDKTVFYDGRARLNLAPQKRRVGYLFQNYALFPNMTVEANVAAGLRDRRKENRQKKVGELLKQFHLEGLEKQYPYKLSGGQQQRAALARILASEPDILLLDEPFSAMDSYLKEELQLELKEHLNHFPGCTIIVSHDRDEIYRLCDRTMVMGEGVNLVCGDTKELFDEPRRMMAARLTGCKNISRAERRGEDRVYAADWGIEFRVHRRIPEKLAYVGVRAHDFLPVGEGTQTENLIRVLPGEKTESPFEWILLFQNADEPKGAMWMKRERGDKQIPRFVHVNPEKILLLEE